MAIESDMLAVKMVLRRTERGLEEDATGSSCSLSDVATTDCRNVQYPIVCSLTALTADLNFLDPDCLVVPVDPAFVEGDASSLAVGLEELVSPASFALRRMRRSL